jgi:hypothetical protein
MGQQFTKLELRQIAGFLRKVYPGQADQDSLWGLIEKTEQLIKGKHGTQSERRRGDSQGSV